MQSMISHSSGKQSPEKTQNNHTHTEGAASAIQRLKFDESEELLTVHEESSEIYDSYEQSGEDLLKDQDSSEETK
jgi:hypothetical protein